MQLQKRRPAWPTIVAAIALVVLAGALGLAGWLALQDGGPPGASTAGVLRLGLSAPLNTLDPTLARTTTERSVGAMIFEGVVVTSGDGTLTPQARLAERLPAPSTDGLAWTISCRRDVSFHDGQGFSCRDVLDSLERLRAEPELIADDPVDPSTLLALLARIDSVQLADDYTLNVHLRQPFSYFNEALMHPAAVVARGEMGTGPFALQSWDEEGARLAAYDDYWDGPPELERVTVEVVPDDETRQNGLGPSFDVIADPLPAADYDGQTEVLLNGPGAQVIFIAVNRSIPPLDDPAIRDALALGVDESELAAEAYAGNARPAMLFASPVSTAYSDLPAPANDLRRAREMQANAGLPDGYDVVLRVDQQAANWTGLSESLDFQLGDLYIEGGADRLDGPLGEAFGGDRPASLVVTALTPLDDYGALHWLAERPPPQGANFIRYENATFSAWIEQATAALSVDAREAAVAEAREALDADPPVIYLVSPDVLAATTGEVSNLKLSPLGWIVVDRETLVVRQ